MNDTPNPTIALCEPTVRLTQAFFRTPGSNALTAGFIRDTVTADCTVTQDFVNTALQTLAAGTTVVATPPRTMRFLGTFATTQSLTTYAPPGENVDALALVGSSLYYSTGAAWATGSGGGAGPVSWTDLLDRTTAPLPTENTPLANALAARAPVGELLAVTADRAIAVTDANDVLNTGGTSRALTVPPDLEATFLTCMVEGPCTWVQGAGVTIAQDRQSGKGYNFCQLVRVATNTYRVIGATT